MKIYTTLHVGEHHINHCEDYLVTYRQLFPIHFDRKDTPEDRERISVSGIC